MYVDVNRTEQKDGWRSGPTLRDVAKRAYALHGDSDEAFQFWLRQVEEEGLEAEGLALLGRILLDHERITANRAPYAKAKALTGRLTVEPPPNGYQAVRDPHVQSPVRERVSSVEEVMTGDEAGRGYSGRRPVAALRAFLDVKIRIDRKVVRPGMLTRKEMIDYASRLEKQGRGCLEHAQLMRDLADVTKRGERGAQAVRRLERGE